MPKTALSEDMMQLSPAESSWTRWETSQRSIVLTGASGFVGRHILQSLIEDNTVSLIHYIGFRHRSEDDPIQQKLNTLIASSPKVVLHPGDLEAPRLGLSEVDFAKLAQQTDLVIHSCAKRSSWSAHDSVRAVNVQSTKELARLVASSLRDHKRIVPIYYLSGSENLTSEPATDGSMGYVASKWASERYADHLNLPVHIHRQLPVPAARETTAEELDQVCHEFAKVAAKMNELPSGDFWSGQYDLIPADRLARDIVSRALETLMSTQGAIYHHSHASSVRINIGQVVQRLEASPEYADSDRPKIPGHLWVGKAKLAGFRYQLSSMRMSLQDVEGKSLGELQR